MVNNSINKTLSTTCHLQ